MVNVAELTQDYVADRFRYMFTSRVGFKRDFSTEQLAEKTYQPKRTVESHHQGQSVPSLHVFARYQAVLEGPFANDFLSLSGLTGAHSIEGPVHTPQELLDHLCQEAAQLAGYLSDGHLDHRERLALLERLPKIISVLSTAQQTLKRDQIHAVAAE